jgi:serralysin
MFGSSTATTATTATGDNNIDGLMTSKRWKSNVVTYGFTDNFGNDYESGYQHASVHSTSFQTLNATQRAVMRNWTKAYYANSLLVFTEQTGAADRDATIRIGMSNDPGESAYAYNPQAAVEGGDIFFNRTNFNTPVIGNYAYQGFGHELGHALGLKHPHESTGVSNVTMNANRESHEFSIMSYRSYIGAPVTGRSTNETWGYAQSLMMYDIRAIQQEYGAWFGSNATNTNYTFSTTTGEMFINGVGQGTPGANRIFRTIWDGYGTDTYDFSNYSTNLSIDLTPGGWSDLAVGSNFQRANLDQSSTAHYARGHVFNALQYNGDIRSLIENATGGSGNDRIVGNSANNVIRSGAGNDSVDGGAGNDTIYLGAGNDFVSIFSSGDDKFYGETGDDYIDGSSGNETFDGGADNDTLFGRGGYDMINGGSGNDIINGGSGQDQMDGGIGIDTVDYSYWNGGGSYNLATGVASFPGYYNEQILNFENITTGNGIDKIIGTATANTIKAGDGDDNVDGGDGNDIIYLGAGNDTANVYSFGDDKFYGEAGDDYIDGWSGNETYDGGTGNDTLYGYGGNDIMDGGIGIDFMNGGTGNDTYYVDNIGDKITETSTSATEIDTVYASISYTLVLNVERLTLSATGLINGSGNNLNNIIKGTSGANTLYGGAGNDTLTGSFGADRFEFKRKTDGIDSIDFKSAEGDKIVISASGFGGGLVAGQVITSSQLLVSAGSAATNTSQRLIYNLGSGGLFFDADGLGGTGAFQFATLSAHPTTLATTNFVIA